VDNQHTRHGHFLELMARRGTEEAKAHIEAAVAERIPSRERVRQYVEDIMTWLHGQSTTYAHVVDEHTGAPLSWWEGRRQTIAAMRQTYEAIGKASDMANAARDMQRNVHGFHRPSDSFAQTPMREPGEEEDAL
jgi:hypothetical protein